MAHRSNAFGGQMQTWARRFGTWGFDQLVRAGSRAPFVASCGDEPCVIVPSSEPYYIWLSVFYGAKRALSIERVAHTSPFDLAARWERYCRAFVICALDPSRLPMLSAWDHNCTRNAKSELLRLDDVQLPKLAELDAAMRTSLEFSEAKPVERVWEAIYEADHH